MTAKVYILVALFGALFVQGTIATTETVEIDWGGIIDSIKDWCQQQINNVKKFFEDAMKTINEKWESLKNKANEIFQNVKAKVSELIDALKGKISQAVDEANKLGVDVTDCVKNETDAFNDLAQKILQRELDCLKNEYDKAEQVVLNMTSVVTDIWDAIQSLPDGLGNCMTSSTPMDCISDLVKQLSDLVKNVPSKLADIISGANSIITKIESDLIACGTKVLAQGAIDGGLITADILKCIANKEIIFKMHMSRHRIAYRLN